MKMIFPEIFITGIATEGSCKKSLCADGLVGWANCMSGSEPPEKFGEGMVEIGKKLGISASPDNFSKYADSLS